ncbi:hypothetical protein [Limosilactobacillus vaginalis]|uniref:hypothetical protein n=1 Tax=Limosilactobacillus vaginalis TaxID=1633 RepID=UPI001D3DA437|nr:hypothetical protein [Limosilactobacillus vaginalis]HJG17356.1 hypothetical protein [Limosilactobacillus vaginalis]
MVNNGIDMSDFLQKWLDQVKMVSTELTPTEQEKIALAGGKVFQEKLEKVNREKHYSHHNDKVYGHAADHIDVMNSDVDGEHNGSVTVGWQNRYHAMNMMRLNDGYKGYQADHFVTNIVQDREIQAQVLKAESDEYQKMLDKAGDE